MPISGTRRMMAGSQNLPEFDAYSTYNFLDMDFGYGRGSKLLDKSPFHAHGDITTASWANGLHHGCLDFNSATPDYVEIAASYDHLNFTSEDFSIVARVNPDALAVITSIFWRGALDADGYLLYIRDTGYILFRTNQSAARQDTYTDDGKVAIGSWSTIGVSRDGASAKIYVDGVDSTLVSGTHINPATCARSAGIGINSDLVSNPFDGKIEFLRIFGGIALPAEAHLWFHNQLK